MRIQYLLLKRTALLSILLCGTLIASGLKSIAQEHSEPSEEEEKGAHKITLSIGHAHIHEGLEGGEKKWLVKGSWALNYDYLFNSHWALGLHNDLILEDFTVEDHIGSEQSTVIERERPFATKLVGSFTPARHITFMLGAGEELAKGDNYFLSTAGMEYGWHLPGGWEVGAELAYDLKWKAYDTWILGFGISKVLSGNHKHHKG